MSDNETKWAISGSMPIIVKISNIRDVELLPSTVVDLNYSISGLLVRQNRTMLKENIFDTEMDALRKYHEQLGHEMSYVEYRINDIILKEKKNEQ